ncbi:MAG: NADH-quinone oxidoreductase subunit NuoH [Pirellulales bacterium]|nr:NADH-quinone oxidoreductase subunit NuoH [Pirellulales bacterium]
MTALAVETLIKIAVFLFAMMTAAAYLVLLERWICAWVQDRQGPNRVGVPLTNIKLFGLGQPLADGIKMIMKQEYTPKHVDTVVYYLAPVTILAAALGIFAVIPWGSYIPATPSLGIEKPVSLVIAPNVDVGLVFVFAVSSLAVYGVILGGWASNNKYSFIGALRSSAQLIAYELPLGLGILGVVLVTGSLRLEEIMREQIDARMWFVFSQPLGFLVFLVAAFAESARLPFDLPECEQELIGGYHTEYSGIRLLMYLIAEFLHMVTASFLIVVLYLGGWHFDPLTGSDWVTNDWIEAILRIVVLTVKVLAVIVFFMIVRWSWPRFRFDQLMTLAWKVMLPLGLVNLFVTAALVEYGSTLSQHYGDENAGLIQLAVSWGALIVSCVAAALAAPLASDNRPRIGLPQPVKRPRAGSLN